MLDIFPQNLIYRPATQEFTILLHNLMISLNSIYRPFNWNFTEAKAKNNNLQHMMAKFTIRHYMLDIFPQNLKSTLQLQI